jgi:hydrogenase maturation factor
MHFATGELIEIIEEGGERRGKIRVGGAVTEVALNLLPEAEIGDTVLAHAGVAISRVESE